MRRDLHPVLAGDEISIELAVLTLRRTDLMRDRTRTINRLRALLSTYFPALERSLDIGNVRHTTLLISRRRRSRRRSHSMRG
ncbi:hypothetical protein C7T36_10985 [Rhodococcus sp. AD45-ID]|uniref:IS110 family transposase n=1 Tax=unclassified Rhodococcus (in: high G+C Gram-positive bacteria) TaxID=192944 RepID=UPI000A017111|nr:MULTISPECIES: transposase [unclassified Rhodococcus (in: high G+C Gram-positive bacteria)]PSR42658.1 hypothetical protein C7T36_10985 [Rhodococcus sp. AD45-ID]